MNLRSSFLLAIISLSFGLTVFYFFSIFSPRESFSGEGCIILVFDETEDDRIIQENLALVGLDDFVSKSKQKVFIDGFVTFRMIPLDTFFGEIEAFDPRDDGYAARLSSFFVRDGKQYFYYYFNQTQGIRARELEQQLNTILDIPFNLYILGQNRSFFWDFIFLAAACLSAFLFSRSKRSYFFQLPVLFALGWAGPAAIVLAGFFSGIIELLKEPLLELSAARRYNRRSLDYAGIGMKGIRERLKPFKINLYLVFLFSFFIFLFSILVNLSLIPVIIGFLSFFILIFLSFHFESDRDKQHKRFVPVVLFPFKINTFSLFPFLLPFALMSIVILFFPHVFFQPSESSIIIEPEYLISSEEHARHIEFTRFFSYRDINQNIDEPYSHYYLGEDGLIAGAYPYDIPWAEDLYDIHFPLEKLMTFLLNYSKPAVDNITPNAGVNVPLNQWVFIFIILAVCIMDLFRRGKPQKKKAALWGDKRIAA